jgi:MULE transposase domain
MAYFSNLFTSSPTTSSPEALFFTPLSNRARSTSPGQSPVSPTPGRLLLLGVEAELNTSTPGQNEDEFTGFSDSEGSNNDTCFTISVPTHDLEGQPMQFVSRDTAFSYLQTWAGSKGFAIKRGRTTTRSDKITVYKQTFHCVCGSSKHNSNTASPLKKRKGRGKNVACSWHCIMLEQRGIWRAHMGHCSKSSLEPSNLHTHPITNAGEYPTHRRRARQYEPGIQARILADHKVKTITRKETHIAVSQQFPGVDINLKDIFNIQAKKQFEKDDNLPAVQALIRDMGESFHFHYSIDENERLVNLIFLEKSALDLLRRWSFTIVLDATYKTNKFGLYLVDIVGTTGSGKTFIIAQALLSAEGEDDYGWMLEWLKDVYVKTGLDMPISITSDRALGLLAALKKVFPSSHHLLCTVHINRDVLTWCKTFWQDELLTNVGGQPLSFSSDDETPQNSTPDIATAASTDNGLISTEERAEYITSRTERFLLSWNAVMNATTLTGEQGFETAWKKLRLYYLGEAPEIVTYLENTWMLYKKSFCKAWTNLIRHFGNTTSNRAEGSHRGVKKKLPQRRLHIRTVVDIMKAYLEVINKDHLKDVEHDRTSIGNYFIRPVLHKVKHRVSIFAIRKIEEHLSFFKEKHLSALPRCKGSFSRTWGIPCAHTVYAKAEALDRLEISDFHPQWHLRRERDFPLIDPSLLLRDPLVVRDSKSKGKASKTGRMWSRFEHVDQDTMVMTTPKPHGQMTALSGQRTPLSPRKQAPMPYWKYTKNGKGPPAPSTEESIRLACTRLGRPRVEYDFAAASYYLDLEGRCRISDDPVALHDEHGWTHITACGNARTDPFDDKAYPEYEEELYTYFGDVLMTPSEKGIQAEMLQQWSECQANPRYVYTWKDPQTKPQPQQDTVVDSIEQDIPPPPPRVLKSALKRQHEPEQEEVDSEVVFETQGAYRGTRSRSRSVAPRKRVRFSETV